jgi:hypothetical protein
MYQETFAKTFIETFLKQNCTKNTIVHGQEEELVYSCNGILYNYKME